MYVQINSITEKYSKIKHYRINTFSLSPESTFSSKELKVKN